MNKTIYSQDHKHLVRRLKKARIQAGLGQKKAGDKIGKSQSYISKIESGQRRVDVVQLKIFAKAYGTNIEFFIKN